MQRAQNANDFVSLMIFAGISLVLMPQAATGLNVEGVGDDRKGMPWVYFNPCGHVVCMSCIVEAKLYKPIRLF